MKIRSRSGVKKRIKKTGTGKYRFEKSCKRHLLAQKSKRQKNIGGSKIIVNDTQAKYLAKVLSN